MPRPRLEPDYSRRLARPRDRRRHERRRIGLPVTVRLERLDPAHEGRGRDGQGPLRGRLRRRAQRRARVARAGAARRLGQSGLGRHGRAGGHRLPRHPPEVGDPVGRRGHRCSSSRARAAISFRIYIELDKLSADERVASRNITPDDLIAAARRILHPYTLEVKEIAWWSVYEIGQRLCDKFDDVAAGEAARPRPARLHRRRRLPHPQPQSRAGHERLDAGRLQSRLETRLGSARAAARPSSCTTYSAERQAVAQELIDFDRELASDVQRAAEGRRSTPAAKASIRPSSRNISCRQAPLHRRNGDPLPRRRSSGPSRLFSISPKGFVIGMRFHSAPVIRLADAKPVHLGHAVKADGRWRLFVFADREDPASPSSRSRALMRVPRRLAVLAGPQDTRPTGPTSTPSSTSAPIFQQGHRELAIEAMPAFLLPGRAATGFATTKRCSAPT